MQLLGSIPCIHVIQARSDPKGKKEKKEKKESLRHSYELVNYRPPAGAGCVVLVYCLCTPPQKQSKHIHIPPENEWLEDDSCPFRMLPFRDTLLIN